ncbi:hypothetical protein BDK89_3259 [Ilumatobacter fluminis]|uniref:Xaa-Pro dipeptidyl-peptidase C-terminal domain-containing protein n=1 Tax=Ilumatobacter fluminis TaxID=467091 RepID=A0A4V3EJB1_9ACTN|nr:CocE/NonD family hydrolase [Ilumatobacter fluminis]TDT17648.1 hypothetical protein BDK89_3259 [Ilumatobacter fluminis]
MRRTAIVIAFASVVAACSGGDVTSTPVDTGPEPSAFIPPSSTTAPDANDGDAGNGGDGNGDDGEVLPTVPPAPTTRPAPTTLPPSPEVRATFSVSPGIEQVTVRGAEPDTLLTLVDRDGSTLAAFPTDANGALIFRDLDGGTIVRVRDEASVSSEVKVIGFGDTPTPSFYAEQRLPTDGLGYITTRDGTTLSASVWLPGEPGDGPYPTVVEYSGYTPSDPGSTGFPDLFNALGYAYVGVNMRGTGCSGGSFRYFEHAQSTDGYDAIEVVAAQPWALGGRVGMVGVSYPGISQLFVARTQPPSLAAITPFSVIADSYASTLYPGGILNTGFAVPWSEAREADAEPEGQAWAAARIAAGDDTCTDNQLLRLQNVDQTAVILDNPFWTEATSGEVAPRTFVDEITVPTFVAGAWQDEQTGGHFATMLDGFTGTDAFYASLTNGLHTESIGPAVFPRFVEFLDLYVAERVPSLDGARTVAPLLAAGIFGTDAATLPDGDRFAGMTYDEALTAFEAEPPIEVLFEEGAADGLPPLTPLPRYSAGFDAWPIPDAQATAWYLSGDGVSGGVLASEPTDAEPASTTYLALPEAIPQTFYEGSSSSIWTVDVTYDWQESGPGTYAGWLTEPLAEDVAVIGSGSVDLFLQSNLGDTDVEVTLTEVRPDGQELYVQSGWLRASHRALDEAASTELRPVATHLEADAAPLPDGEFELVRVEILPVGHVFRAGSQLRLVVDAPGGNRAVWAFDTTIAQGEQVTIGHDTITPSRLVLPVVDGIDAPDPAPACDSLRGQPCRTYRAP